MFGYLADLANNCSRIYRRIGVGHGYYSGISTKSGLTCSSLYGLGFFHARLPQMSMEIDKAGGYNTSIGLQHKNSLRR
jgi:hypothetical protein